MRNRIRDIVLSHDWALQIHGFSADIEMKTVRFDVVVSFDVDKNEAVKELLEEVSKEYPDYKFTIVPDADVSD